MLSMPPNLFELPPLPLPEGLRSRQLNGVNGLNLHLLEAGFDAGPRPTVLLLHGFPELAYSWRHVMPALAAAGYHVVAPDQRGYGRTVALRGAGNVVHAGASQHANSTSSAKSAIAADQVDKAAGNAWHTDYDSDLQPSHLLSLAGDAVALVAALGLRQVHAVVGHDFGSMVAAWCALLRPDVFRSVVLMSAPFGGAPAWPAATNRSVQGTSAAQAATPKSTPLSASDPAPEPPSAPAPTLDLSLAALPRPRVHYQRYYSTRQANADMLHCPQGVHDFLRAYYHVKSADWPDNRPRPLAAMSAQALAELPTYYVMDAGRSMAETVAEHMPSPEHIASSAWLPEAELAVYAAEFGRTGFQGGLQWYRSLGSAAHQAQFRPFAGRRIEVPCAYIAGASDWGIYQKPGTFEAMSTPRVCADWRGSHLLPGAGHWVQQEQAEAVNQHLLAFLAQA